MLLIYCFTVICGLCNAEICHNNNNEEAATVIVMTEHGSVVFARWCPYVPHLTHGSHMSL